jgi:hypothetical protein
MKKYKTIAEFLEDQSPEQLEQITLLRTIIMGAEPSLTENLKWNAPNYVYKAEDRITFNLMNKEGKVKLILHMGATKKEEKKGQPVLIDNYGIVEWNSDIRGTITFKDIDDIKEKSIALSELIKKWLLVSDSFTQF